jgi:molybdate transport repressor ModE-like protein
MREISLGQLELFERVAQEGSISAAARALGLSVATASRQLQQLEQHLGAPLFNRSTRSLALTQQGERFRDDARQILNTARGAKERARSAQEEVAGRLHVSVPSLISATAMGEALASLRRAHPALTLEVEVSNARVDLWRAKAELAVRFGAPPSQDALLVRRIARFDSVLAARSSEPSLTHPLALLDRPLILSPHDLGTLSAALDIEQDRLREQVVVFINDRLAIKDAICAGAGIGLLPTFLCDALTLKPILPALHLPVGDLSAVTLPTLRGDVRVNAFIQALQDALKAPSRGASAP